MCYLFKHSILFSITNKYSLSHIYHIWLQEHFFTSTCKLLQNKTGLHPSLSRCYCVIMFLLNSDSGRHNGNNNNNFFNQIQKHLQTSCILSGLKKLSEFFSETTKLRFTQLQMSKFALLSQPTRRISAKSRHKLKFEARCLICNLGQRLQDQGHYPE